MSKDRGRTGKRGDLIATRYLQIGEENHIYGPFDSRMGHKPGLEDDSSSSVLVKKDLAISCSLDCLFFRTEVERRDKTKTATSFPPNTPRLTRRTGLIFRGEPLIRSLESNGDWKNVGFPSDQLGPSWDSSRFPELRRSFGDRKRKRWPNFFARLSLKIALENRWPTQQFLSFLFLSVFVLG